MCSSYVFKRPLIINPVNMDKIKTCLDTVQKRSRERLLEMSDILSFVNDIKKFKENHGLSWQEIDNCQFALSSYEGMPNSYSYPISYSRVYVIVKGRTFRISKIFRGADSNKKTRNHKRQAIYLTEKAKRKIAENARYM